MIFSRTTSFFSNWCVPQRFYCYWTLRIDVYFIFNVNAPELFGSSFYLSLISENHWTLSFLWILKMSKLNFFPNGHFRASQDDSTSEDGLLQSNEPEIVKDWCKFPLIRSILRISQNSKWFCELFAEKWSNFSLIPTAGSTLFRGICFSSKFLDYFQYQIQWSITDATPIVWRLSLVINSNLIFNAFR